MQETAMHLFHMPLRLYRAWVGVVREQHRLRQAYPNGGRCHTCGQQTDPDQTECQECYEASRW